jgi:hypothetical protein
MVVSSGLDLQARASTRTCGSPCWISRARIEVLAMVCLSLAGCLDHGKRVAFATGGLGIAAGAPIVTLGVTDQCAPDATRCHAGRDALLLVGGTLVAAGIATICAALDGTFVK